MIAGYCFIIQNKYVHRNDQIKLEILYCSAYKTNESGLENQT